MELPYIDEPIWARFIKSMVQTKYVASQSRSLLFAGTLVMILGLAFISTMQGQGFILPMAVIFSLTFLFMFFSSMKNTEQEVRGSTPISTNSVGSKLSIEKDNEDLPDPENFGFDVPNL